MKRFLSSEIIEVAKGINSEVMSGTNSAGGDYDTISVILQLPSSKDSISVCGFRTGSRLTERDNVDVDMIEVRNFDSDSEGGLQISDEKLGAFGGMLYARLKKQGWGIARNLKEYF